jgi:Fic family protein
VKSSPTSLGSVSAFPPNPLPLLPPATDLETKAVLKRCVAANRALAELKGAGDLIPNQAVLKELVEIVFTQPYCKIQFLVDAGLAERKTASEYLQELEKLGILKGEKRGREVLYKHPALLKALAA